MKKQLGGKPKDESKDDQDEDEENDKELSSPNMKRKSKNSKLNELKITAMNSSASKKKRPFEYQE